MAQDDLVFLLHNLGLRIFQVESGDELFSRLIERVVDLLFLDFRNDIKRRHRWIGYGLCSAILMLPSSVSN